ncbi:hypothetical protein CDAR_567531 [Caerostris darwini]|uniref:Uncharacterized protein n=1 Tax=Caerostris darwini TaxID=1538125 RepID=A0AAV4QZ62_9ARAC|nr:hypothetical protein CDAR_567531 [Caerostris darwini]
MILREEDSSSLRYQSNVTISKRFTMGPRFMANCCNSAVRQRRNALGEILMTSNRKRTEEEEERFAFREMGGQAVGSGLFSQSEGRVTRDALMNSSFARFIT